MERATEHAERTLNMHNPAEGWHLVTQDSHPALFLVFESISHDAGFGAGHDNYSVPVNYTKEQLLDLDMILTMMGTDKARDFAIGGEDDRPANLSEELQILDKFLNHFFNDWEDENDT